MSDDIVKWLRIDSSIRNELNDCITDPTTLNKAAEEIERLREALREIAGARPKCCEITDAMQYIASAALATGGERGPQ